MSPTRTLRVLLLFALLSPLRAQMNAYMRMGIEPGSRVVSLSNEVSILRSPPKEEYFQRGPSWNIERVVPALEKRATHPEYFHVSRDGVLFERSKYQEVFANDLATIVAQTRYHYESEYGPEYGASITLDVRADKSTIRREPSNVIGGLPSTATPLHMISVIRLSTLEGIDLAAVATYDAAGELFSVAVDALKQGEAPPRRAKIRTIDEDIQESIRQFGFPLRFAIDEFRRSPMPLYERTDGPSPLTVVSLHYELNRYVQQYIFPDSLGGPAKYQTRTLEFRSTEQDEALRSSDQTLPWKSALDQRMFFPKK